MKFKRICARLTAVFLTFFIVSFTLLSAISYYFSQKYVKSGIESLGKAIATDYSHRLETHINDMMTQVLALGAAQSMRSGNRQQIVGAMNELHKRAGIFDVILFAGPTGAAVRWNGEAADYSDRDYFKQVMQTQKPCVSDVIVSKTNGNMIIALAVPVLDNGRMLGVLVVTYNLEKLSEFLNFIQFEQSGYGYLMDNKGMVIGNPRLPETIGKLYLSRKQIDPSLNLQSTQLDDTVLNLYQKARESSAGPVYGDFTFIDGVEQTGAFVPVNLTGASDSWTLAVMAPTVEVMSGMRVFTMYMFMVSLFFILIAFVFIVFISKGICRPINELVTVAGRLADGDLSAEIDVNRVDELGTLQSEIKTMAQQLRTLVKNIHDSADNLVSAAQSLTDGAHQSAAAADSVTANVLEVARGTSKQMDVAKEATVAIGKLAADAEQAAAGANIVRDTSDKTAQSAAKGVKVVETAVNQMSFIQSTVETLAKEIAGLGARSDEIGQIVETISGIAGQTNLLALNAAIEAARAGEQGRGFAVVAEEVRKLAEQSQDAAKQISGLISAIQQDTAKAVQAMETGIREVKTGSKLVDNAGESFKEIEGFIGDTTVLMLNVQNSAKVISQDTRTVLAGTEELYKLSQGISGQTQSVSAATEEQLATMQEIASASQDFNKLAENLQTMVRGFKL